LRPPGHPLPGPHQPPARAPAQSAWPAGAVPAGWLQCAPPDIWAPSRQLPARGEAEDCPADQDRQTGRHLADRFWGQPQPLRRVSKAVPSSMMRQVIAASFQGRTGRISRVVQLPITCQITFGGAPRSRLNARKSSSFVTTVMSAAPADFQMP